MNSKIYEVQMVVVNTLGPLDVVHASIPLSKLGKFKFKMLAYEGPDSQSPARSKT